MSTRGRGKLDLSSLADTVTTTAATRPAPPRTGTGTRAVPVAKIAANPLNSRRLDLLDPAEIQQLGDSLLAIGQLESCAVVHRESFLAIFPEHSKKVGNADYVQVSGGRRLIAARASNILVLDVTVKDALAVDRMTFLAATARENFDRKDLDPIEEAVALQYMADEVGQNQSTVAEKLGKTRAWVSQRVGLLRLVPQLQDLVSSKAIPIAAARSLSAEDPQHQLALWADMQRAMAEPDETPAADEPAEDPAPGGRDPKAASGRPRTEVQVAAIRRLGKNPQQWGEALASHVDREDLLQLWTILGERLGVAPTPR